MKVHEAVEKITFKEFWTAFSDRHQIKSQVKMTDEEDRLLAQKVYGHLRDHDEAFDIGGCIRLYESCVWRNTYLIHGKYPDKKIWLDYIPWKEIANMDIHPFYDESGKVCSLEVFLALMYFDMTYHGIDEDIFETESRVILD